MTELNPLCPLPLHMANSLSLWSSAPLAAMTWQLGQLPLHPKAAALFDQLKDTIEPSEAFALQMAVAGASTDRTKAFLDGVEAYRHHPYRRHQPMVEAISTFGTTRLLDYGGTGQPILLVPSLINPATILDLMPGRSFVDHTCKAGFRPFLVDWQSPGEAETPFSIDDYITERLVPILDHVTSLSGGAVPVIGYCMGGTLLTALACLKPAQISALVLLAAPWDFDADPTHAALVQAAKLAAVLKGMPKAEPVSFEILQSYFAALDPTLADKKFRRFGTLDPHSDDALFFVAMEQWANSGPGLAGPAARQSMVDWYEKNIPGRGQWQIQGTPIHPSTIACPTLAVCPARDRLVPPAAARALAAVIPGAELHDPGAGHVGMMVGSKAASGVYHPVSNWLKGVL